MHTKIDFEAVEREAVLRRISDAERFEATETCMPRVTSEGSFTPWRNELLTRFMAELSSVGHLTNFPYPETAKYLASIYDKTALGPASSARVILGLRCWPLGHSENFGVILPTQLLPMVNAFEKHHPKWEHDKTEDAVLAASTHAERLAAAKFVFAFQNLYGGRFCSAFHIAHLNGLLHDAGLRVNSSNSSVQLRPVGLHSIIRERSQEITDAISNSAICDHGKLVRAISDTSPDAGHAVLFEPYQRPSTSMRESLKQTRMLASWMGPEFGVAGARASESVLSGGGKTCILLIAHRHEIAKLGKPWIKA